MLCFGITVPTAATQLRVCLLDGSLLTSGSSCLDQPGTGADPCCGDSDGESENCCADLKKLPDSNLRLADAEIPLMATVDLPPTAFHVPLVVASDSRPFQPSVPIRGPDSPSARRAVLAVWTL